jgi:hypothetical protein
VALDPAEQDRFRLMLAAFERDAGAPGEKTPEPAAKSGSFLLLPEP